MVRAEHLPTAVDPSIYAVMVAAAITPCDVVGEGIYYV
jgi:hypothetical protein